MLHPSPALLAFLNGMLAAACFVAALFFAKFWRSTRDAFFALFAGAFGSLGLCWTVLALTDPRAESRPYVYLLRLVGFLLILVAIVQKNRGRGKRRPDADR